MREKFRGRRFAAVLTATVVAALVAFPASAATTPTKVIPLDTWSGRASGSVVDLKVTLPPAIVSAFETFNVDNPLGSGIADQIVGSSAEAQWKLNETGTVTGTAVGQLFDPKGSVGSIVQSTVGLPRATASLGQTASDELLRFNNSGISIGAGTVDAAAAKLGTRVLDSDGSSKVVDLNVRLADLLSQLPDSARSQVDAGIDALLGVLYGGNADLPEAFKDGIIPTLQAKLDEANAALKAAGVDVEGITNLKVKLPTITKNDLINKPMLHIGVIESTSDVTEGTGALKGYKVSTATSYVKDVSVLGGLVGIDVLKSTAGVAVNGKPGQAKLLPPVQTASGITLGDNRIAIGDFTGLAGITVNGKGVNEILADINPSLASTIDGLYGTLLEQVVGVGLSVPAIDQGIAETKTTQKAHQRVTALLLNVEPLKSNPLGVDLSAARALLPTVSVKFASANAEIGSVPLKILGKCVGDCSPKTGVATTFTALLGFVLLGVAVMTRRFLGQQS